MAYLVADWWHNPPAHIPPHWRVVGYFDSVVHAKAFASSDGIVTQWDNPNEAWKAYRAKRLPEGGYSVIA